MALVNCPECEKEISDKTYKCNNCGFVINKPKRGVTGVIFKSLFIIFNAIMIFLLVTMWMSNSTADVDMGTASVIGSGMIIFIWILIGLPLGIMNYVTRPKAYD